MTRLLNKAIEDLRSLPEDEQEAAALFIFSYLSTEPADPSEDR
jgi:hypothetical protein